MIHLLEEDHDLAGEHRHRLRAAGRPMEGVEVRIVEPATGCDVATGDVGEILMRTPRVMLGYWNQPEATPGDHVRRMGRAPATPGTSTPTATST